MGVYNTKTLKQGIFKPVNRKKYTGTNIDKIVYRSGLERKFMKYCDHSDSILKWESETVVIPYKKPTDNKIHRYYMDFWIEKELPGCNTKQYLVEIKPYDFLTPPKPRKRKTKKYLAEIENYAVNMAKWKQARIFAEERNMTFTIITEKTLGK